jgi:phosphoribosylglycinamide formyltransferase-1
MRFGIDWSIGYRSGIMTQASESSSQNDPSASPEESPNTGTDAAGPKLAILISGGGRTLENLATLIQAGKLNASIVTVVSSRTDAFGLQRSAEFNIPAQAIVKKTCKSADEFSDLVWGNIRQAGANLVVMAGWMNLLPIPDDYEGRVINIHPALLPDFGGKGMYGHHVHEAVLAAGCKTTGCTVHYCDNTYDTGPVILQRSCEVRDDDTPDTLAARVFEQECIAYPEAIRLLAK